MNILIKICLALCVLAFFATVGDYSALHDIGHDYVSKKVIDSYGSGLPLDLPEWTETKSEWWVINISGVIRIIYLAFSAVTLTLCLKVLKKKK